MTVKEWLAWATADAVARKIDGLPPLLETLAQALQALRDADWNLAADAEPSNQGAGSERDARVRAGLKTAPYTPARGEIDPIDTQPELLPVSALQPRLRDGRLTARDLAEACLARIERLNPSVNAIVHLLADETRTAAARADDNRAAGRLHGPLHGIPVTLKDLIDLEGAPTTAGSAVRRGHRARRDATITRRLREAGAIIIGKTNLHEFAFGTTNEDSVFGPTRHPVDLAMSPGGSSGGSAAAVRSGMCAASVGTDTGGSIRIPAAACGLVGLKPTFGEVPLDGVVPLAWSLDHAGPLARSVEDAWLLFDVLAGRRAPDVVTRDRPSIASLRCAVVRPFFCDLLDDGVRREFERAVERLAREGATIATASIAHASLTPAVYLHTVMSEAMAYHAATLDRVPGAYTPNVRTRLEMGRYVLGEDYVRAMRGRDVLRAEVDRLLEESDVVIVPTLPMAAPKIGASTVRLGDRVEPVRAATLRLTQLFDLTGHPAVTLPVGEVDPGFPAGLQLVGRRHETDRLMALALACEGLLTR